MKARLTLLLLGLLPALVLANTVGSSTLEFEGALTDAGGGIYTGTIAATAGSGFDIYGEEGVNAWFGDNPGPVWTSLLMGADHDAWPTWDPDTPDWYQYSLNLYEDAGVQKWAVRNHAGATADHPWYDTAWWGAEIPPMGVPMSGVMEWSSLYAAETDVGAYLPGTGTPEIPNGAAGYGGGAGAWDMDWSWGSEVVPLELAGFAVTLTDLGGDFNVVLTPADPEEVWVDDNFNVSTPGWGVTHFDNIQDGIAAVSGSTVNVAAGTYYETLNITTAGLEIIGENRLTVIIDPTGLATNNAGIYVDADNVRLESLTLRSTISSSVPRYGIKVGDVAGCTLEDVAATGAYRSGIDALGASNLTLSNIYSQDNGGHGLSLCDCNGVAVTGITLSGNGWQNVSVATWGCYTPLGTSGIVFNGSNTFGDLFQLEMGDYNNQGFAPAGDAIITYSTNPVDMADVTVQASDFGWAVHGEQDDGPTQVRIWFMSSFANAAALVALAPTGHWNGNDLYIESLTDGTQLHVTPGGSIQAAIDAADPGDDINVAAGTYVERLLIDKPLTLLGATAGVNKNGYTVPAVYAWDDAVESIIMHPDPAGGYITIVDIYNTDDVTFDGFVVQELSASGNLNSSLLRVYAHTQVISDIDVINCIIGPNTNTTFQDGTHGRMGLYIVNHPYDDNGVTNSTFAGNKVFDCKGNGDNIFLWSSYYAYGAPGAASMAGTVIEDNEIYGSHRSGIETAGGFADLVIRNNEIYNNSELPGDDVGKLKYGHGILLIRGSSDKVSDPLTAYGPEDLTIEGNNIYGNSKSGIYMGPKNDRVTISDNTIHTNGWNGVIVDLVGNYWNPQFEPEPASEQYACYDCSNDVIGTNNSIYGNGTAGIPYAQFGVEVNGEPTNGFVFDATLNWWGDASGPAGEGPGSGDAVSVNVDYSPWLGATPGTSPMTYYADDSIGDALALAGPGDTVFVLLGTYNETVAIGSGFNGGTLLGELGSMPLITGGMTIAGGTSGVTIQNFHITGAGASSSIIRLLGGVSDLTLDNCIVDGELTSGRNGFAGGQLEGDAVVTNCEFKDVLGWALFESRSGSGGGGSPLDDILFTDNSIHNCNGSVVFRGDETNPPTSYTNSVTISGNSWQTIGGNGSETGQQWAAFEVNRAQDVDVFNNSVDDVNLGDWGEGQAAQFWSITDLAVYDNSFTDSYEGIKIFYIDDITSGAISNNIISGNSQFGLDIDDNATSGPLDAENNWWGAADGPSGFGPGTGDSVSDHVDFTPWLTGLCTASQTATATHLAVEEDGNQVPEHDPIQNRTTITYDLAIADHLDYFGYDVHISYPDANLTPLSVTQIYDPGVSHIFTYTPLGLADGHLTVSMALTGGDTEVDYTGNLFSVVFDGILENLTALVEIDSLRVRERPNNPITPTATGDDITIQVDDSVPTLLVTNPAETCVNSEQTFTFDAEDNVDLYRIQYQFDSDGWNDAVPADITGATYTTPDWTTTTLTSLSEGSHTIYFRTWDDVGYVSSESSWTFWLDTLAPTAVTDLEATPEHVEINLTWTVATQHDGYYLYRAKRVTYPYFGGLAVESTWPGDYTDVYDITDPNQTSYQDTDYTDASDAHRAVYDYKIVPYDCVNAEAAVSNTASATNYFLGDVAANDGIIFSGDLAQFSIVYGTTSIEGNSDELDIGPTTDWSSYGLPDPDGVIDFEDLIIFAMNYGDSGPTIPISGFQEQRDKSAPATDVEMIVTLADAEDGYQLVLTGELKGFSARLQTERQLVSATSAGYTVMTYRDTDAWMIDIIALEGLIPDGTSIALDLNGEGNLELTSVDGRDGWNQPVILSFENSLTENLPTVFSLAQNYPNPFNPVTTINYDLAATVPVRLLVYNSLGQQVATLVHDTQPAGRYSVSFDGSSLASGLYFYEIKAGEFHKLQKMMLVK